MAYAAKIAISIDPGLLHQIDDLVKRHVYKNRSQAIQDAVAHNLTKIQRVQFVKACAALDPVVERKMADEGFDEDMKQWPTY